MPPGALLGIGVQQVDGGGHADDGQHREQRGAQGGDREVERPREPERVERREAGDHDRDERLLRRAAQAEQDENRHGQGDRPDGLQIVHRRARRVDRERGDSGDVHGPSRPFVAPGDGADALQRAHAFGGGSRSQGAGDRHDVERGAVDRAEVDGRGQQRGANPRPVAGIGEVALLEAAQQTAGADREKNLAAREAVDLLETLHAGQRFRHLAQFAERGRIQRIVDFPGDQEDVLRAEATDQLLVRGLRGGIPAQKRPGVVLELEPPQHAEREGRADGESCDDAERSRGRQAEHRAEAYHRRVSTLRAVLLYPVRPGDTARALAARPQVLLVLLLPPLAAGLGLLILGVGLEDAAATGLALVLVLLGLTLGGACASWPGARIAGARLSVRALLPVCAVAAFWTPLLLVGLALALRAAGAGPAAVLVAALLVLLHGVACGFGIVRGDEVEDAGRGGVASCVGLAGALLALWLVLIGVQGTLVFVVRAPVTLESSAIESPVDAGDLLLFRRTERAPSGSFVLMRERGGSEGVFALTSRAEAPVALGTGLEIKQLSSDWDIAGRAIFVFGASRWSPIRATEAVPE